MADYMFSFDDMSSLEVDSLRGNGNTGMSLNSFYIECY